MNVNYNKHTCVISNTKSCRKFSEKISKQYNSQLPIYRMSCTCKCYNVTRSNPCTLKYFILNLIPLISNVWDLVTLHLLDSQRPFWSVESQILPPCLGWLRIGRVLCLIPTPHLSLHSPHSCHSPSSQSLAASRQVDYTLYRNIQNIIHTNIRDHLEVYPMIQYKSGDFSGKRSTAVAFADQSQKKFKTYSQVILSNSI